MQDMKRTETDRMDMEAIDMPMSQDEYPYGLCISLDTQTLKKLGMRVSDFEIGQSVNIEAVARVKSLSSEQTESRDGYEIVELQITMMEVEDGREEDVAEAEKEAQRMNRMYGDD